MDAKSMPQPTFTNIEKVAERPMTSMCMLGSLVVIGLIAVQVGAFNFLMPIVFMKTKGWTVADFGIVSSAAAAGAILVGYPRRLFSPPGWRRQFLVIVGSLLACGVMVTSNLFFLVFVGAVLLGAGNSIGRIMQRSYLFDSVFSKSAAVDWATRFNFSNQLGRAFAPVLFACAISYMKWDPASLFVSVGAAVAICATAVLALQYLASRAHA